MYSKQTMKKVVIERIPAIIFVLFVMSSFFIPPIPLSKRIDVSVDKAKDFVAGKNLDEDIFGNDNDICQKDRAKCSINEENFFYKQVDTYLDFVYLKDESFNTSGVEKKISEADIFLRNEVAIFPNRTIDYTYIDSSGQSGNIALDTSCILGWTYNDSYIYNQIRNQLKSYGWTNPKTTESFRKLIDETWCISLLAENNENPVIIKQQIDNKKQEFYNFIDGSDYLDRKIISGIHLLLMFDRLQKYGYDISQYSDFIEFTKSYVVNQTKTGSLYYPLEVYNNVLYTLAKIHYPDKVFLQDLAEKILLIQNQDGSWLLSTEGRYRILETLRCSIALNLFKINYL